MVGKSTIGLEKTQFIKLSGRIFTKKNLAVQRRNETHQT